MLRRHNTTFIENVFLFTVFGANLLVRIEIFYKNGEVSMQLILRVSNSARHYPIIYYSSLCMNYITHIVILEKKFLCKLSKFEI